MAASRQPRHASIPTTALRRLAAESSHEFSAIISPEETIAYVCAGLLKFSKHREDSLRGKPCSSLIRRTDGKPIGRAFLQPRSHANPQRRNFMVVARDGRLIACRGQIYYLNGPGGSRAGALLLGDRVASSRPATEDPLAGTASSSLLESMTDGLCVVDAGGTIVSANPALAGLAGLQPSDMTGVAPPYPWLGADANRRLAGALADTVKTGRPSHALVVLEREGERPYALSFAISRLCGREGFHLASVRDISDVYPVGENEMAEKRIGRLKEQVHRNAVRLRILQEINVSVLRSGSLEAVYRRVTEGVGRLVDHDLAGLYVLDEDGRYLRPQSVSRVTPFSRRLGRLPLTPGEGIVGSAALSGETVIVNDAQNDPRSVYPPGMKPPIEHIIAAPVRGRLSTHGILVVARNRNPGFHEEDAQVVQSFADAASIAIDHIRLHSEPGLFPESRTAREYERRSDSDPPPDATDA